MKEVLVSLSNILISFVSQLIEEEKNPYLESNLNHEYIQSGLAFIFHLQTELNVNGKKYELSRNIHFLFVGKHYVWFAADTRNRHWLDWREVPIEPHNEWQNTSCGSNYWDTDGVRKPLIKEFHILAGKLLHTAGEPEGYSAEDVNVVAFTPYGHKPWEWISVTHKAHKDNVYYRDVLRIEPLN